VSELAIAGANPAKAAALKRVAAALRIRCARRIRVDVDEDGPTFADNARDKALAASALAPGALVMASDGGLEIPALRDRWDPLRTSRFAGEAPPLTKARRLIELAGELPVEARVARWTEALALAVDGRVIACWTQSGPQRRMAASVPETVGAFWVDALLEQTDRAPGHWELLRRRFAEFCAA